MPIQRITWAGILAAAIALSNARFAKGAATELLLIEPWSAQFAGRVVEYHATLRNAQQSTPAIGWSLMVGGRTVAAGQTDAPQPGQSDVVIKLPVPAVKPGVALDAELRLAARIDAQSVTLVRQLAIFPADAFSPLRLHAERLGIVLFDPAKTTAKTLTEAGLPFKTVRTAEALEATDARLLLIAEGLPADRYNNLPAVLCSAAAKGHTAICLAPSSGRWKLPQLSGEDPEVESVAIERGTAIKRLDKRLDAAPWPGRQHQEISSSGLVFKPKSTILEGQVKSSSDSWPWVELKYRSGGRVVFCGYRLMAAWDTNPTPRYMLARLIEQLPSAAASIERPVTEHDE
jgi:hypothetical protein